MSTGTTGKKVKTVAGAELLTRAYLRDRYGMIKPPNGLWGPFSLTPRGIESAISEAAPGVYTLGGLKNGGEDFKVRYVGRDDRDVRASIKRHVADWYPQFFYRYYFSAKSAFEKECELYHNLSPPDNKAHPARPENTDWMCPRCEIFR